MALTVITNVPDGHEGTPDRDLAGVSYDCRAKFDGCLESADWVASLTLPPVDAALKSLLRLRADDGTPLDPMVIRPVSIDIADRELLAVHSQEHIAGLRDASERVRKIRADGNSQYLDQTFGKEAAVSPGTYSAARSAASASVESVTLALQKRANPAFALVWPPGHHAEGSEHGTSGDSAMGFCYLSNAAIAAIYARDHAPRVDPDRPNRVLVIDIDNHSGNGTVKALADEPDMMMVDFRYRSPWSEKQQRYVDFRWDFTHQGITVARQYPYDRSDSALGTSPHPIVEAPNILPLEFWGKATTRETQENPVSRSLEGAASPETVLKRFIAEALPSIQSFKPDVIIISVGVDSAENDPLGGLGFSPGAFYAFTRGMRLAFPDAAHVGILEGGYDSDNWFRCLQPVLVAMHEDPNDAKVRATIFRQVAADFAADPEAKNFWEGRRTMRRAKGREELEKRSSAVSG